MFSIWNLFADIAFQRFRIHIKTDPQIEEDKHLTKLRFRTFIWKYIWMLKIALNLSKIATHSASKPNYFQSAWKTLIFFRKASCVCLLFTNDMRCGFWWIRSYLIIWRCVAMKSWSKPASLHQTVYIPSVVRPTQFGRIRIATQK